jgi:chemotaxis protein MotB
MRRGTALCRAASFGVSFNAYGLNIEIVDRDGRSFPEGPKESNERNAPAHSETCGPAQSSGFRDFDLRPYLRDAPSRPARLSTMGTFRRSRQRRSKAARSGWRADLPHVDGRRACRHPPLFPDDPYIAANRHVTITLMREEPPIPPNFKP